MALNNLYSTSGGIYVRPVGFSDCYPVSGFPHGCKSLLPPSTALTMHSYTSHKPSSRTSAAMSPLQLAHQQNAAISPYNAHLLNSNHTSSFAAALQKLAKQAGEPTTESLISSGNVNQSATMPPMYLTGHQNAFSGSTSPSVTVAPIQYHNGSNRKMTDVTNFTPAVTNSQLQDPLRTKFGSLNHTSQAEKWDDNVIGTKEYLASSTHVMSSLPVPSSSSSSSTSSSDGGSTRGFQPYRLVEERQHHISSHFSMYDTPYPYHPTFLPTPHISPHAYRLEDAFYLERYGLLRTPMVHFPATPSLIPHPHAGYYQPGAYSSDLLTQHMNLSSQNFLLEQERLKREEQRLWVESREVVKLKEQDTDKTNKSGNSEMNGQLSPVSLSKASEFSEKRNGCVRDVIQTVENRKLLSPGCHSAPLNLTVQTKTEKVMTTCTTPDQYFVKPDHEIKCDNLEKKLKIKNIHPDVHMKNSTEIKRTKSDVDINLLANSNKSNNSSSSTNLDKEKLFSLCQKNSQEFLNITKECQKIESQNRLVLPVEEEKRTDQIDPTASEKKFRPFEPTWTDLVNNKMQTDNLFSPSLTKDVQSQQTTEPIRSKLDVEQQKRETAQQNNICEEDYDSESEETKYHFLHIILKGPPLPLDSSPEKLLFFENFNLITEEKKREIELQKMLDRRERLKETNISPPVEVEEITVEEEESEKSLHHNYILPVLIDKITFMEVLKLYPSTSTNIGALNGKCGVKRKFEKTVQFDDISLENPSKDLINPSGPSTKYAAVYNENTLGIIPLVHSAHLYRDLCITCQSEKCKYPNPPIQKMSLNGTRKMSLLKCSKRHQYTKLWVPTKKKPKPIPPVPNNQLEKSASKYQNSVNNIDTKRSASLSLDDDHHAFICDTKELSQNVEQHPTKNPYRWPGIEAVIESYKAYAIEQNLEREILSEKCHSLKKMHAHLTQELENVKSQMSKLLSLKEKLEEERKSYQTTIDNLKRYLEEIR